MTRQRHHGLGTDHGVGPDTLAGALASLREQPRAALVARWTEAHGRPPPKGTSRRLLERSAAHHLQIQALGAPDPATARILRKLTTRPRRNDGGVAQSSRMRLTPGTRLVREWNGRPHTVEVTDRGFVWNGATYRSLSAVARSITGAKWSGPRFFGL